MKKVFFNLLFLLNFVLWAQNFSLDGRYIFEVNTGLARFDLNDHDFIYIFEEDKENLIDKYRIKHIEGLTYLSLDHIIPKEITEDFLYNNKKNVITDDKFLIMAGQTSETKDTILIATTAGFNKYYPCTVTIISEQIREYKDCSSFLTEKTKKYSVENLSKLAVETPWVEGVSGDGIGEGFTIKNSWGKVYPYLLILNGYISYEKPYLYKQNGRIKKIKVTGLRSGKSKVLEVLDTPHPQTVDISFIDEPEDIRVEIADIYKGTKYSDTCIHYMITYNQKVIPYENSIGE